MTPKTLINGQSYNFVDVTFDLGQLIAVTGFNGVPIKSISYDVSQAKSANYENSKYSTSYSYGKMTYQGTVEFTLDTAELLRDSIFSLGIRERSIVSMPATNITLTFSNKGKVNTTTIHNVIFLNEKMSAAEGDEQLKVTCDFLASFIDFGPVGGVSVIGTLAAGSLDIIHAGDNQN